MLGFVGSNNKETLAEYVELLSTAFDGKPYVVEQNTDVAPEMLRAKITEWKLPGAIIAHDGEVNPKDGRFYLVDGDAVFITDPVANKTETVPVPAMNVPLGGNFPALGFADPDRHGQVTPRHAQPAVRTERLVLYHFRARRNDHVLRSGVARVQGLSRRRRGALAAHAALR